MIKVIRKIKGFVDKYYIILMLIMSVLIIYLNYYGYTMLVIYPYYQDLKHIILSGFDPNAGKIGTPTFPMWGYGWLLILTENKIILIMLQFSLALFGIWYFFYQNKKYNIFNLKTTFNIKLLLILSVPWYAFHSIRWPYSISISIILISFLIFVAEFFYVGQNKIKYKQILLSGILFGIAINFRSDYYLLPIGFIIVFLILKKINIKNLKKSFFWITSVYIMLIPWGIYSYKVNGHFKLVSTNSGHVLFIGLGNLPNNKWGITKWDGDPEMHKRIKERFGERKSTLLYETDVFLKKEYLRIIKNDPKEYLRKCLYSLKEMVISGVYPGEFYEKEMLKLQDVKTKWVTPGENWQYEDEYYESKVKYAGLMKRITNNPLKIFSFIKPGFIIKKIVFKFSKYFGKIIVLFSFILIPFTLYFSLVKRNYLMLFIIIIIGFQSAINVFGYNWYLYTSNTYFLHLVNLVFGLHLIYTMVKSLKKT